MRLVLDTNILISALLARTSLPVHLIALWREGYFDLLTAPEQLDELMRVTRYPEIRDRLSTANVRRLIGQLRDLAVIINDFPTIAVSADPYDNYLLAMAAAGRADFLVTGDKRDVLELRLYEGTRILSARDFLTLHRRLP